MYYVYILKSKAVRKSYVGSTDNLERRLAEHNSGRHVYTRRYAPWVILHTEEFANRSEAVRREKYLKSAGGRRFLKKIWNNCRVV